MGDENDHLTGFTWTPGTKGNTTGIVIWSDIFYCEESNGEKVAIILMDTQGMFDTSEKMTTSNKIFTLNSLFASFLIYLNDVILKENAVQYLGVSLMPEVCCTTLKSCYQY
jgi:atlastin